MNSPDTTARVLHDSVDDQLKLVLALVTNAEKSGDVDGLERAKALLNFAALVWEPLGYVAVSESVAGEIARVAREMYGKEQTFLSLLRANAKERHSTVRDIERLRSLAGI